MTRRAVCGLLLALAFGVAFQDLRPLADPDEGRYAEAAREMRVTGDLLTPRLHGQAHLTKPPGTYWAAGAGMAVLGVGRAGVRLPVGVAFAGWIVAAYFLGRRLGGDVSAGLWSAAVLATSVGPFVGGSLLTPDPFIAALDAAAAAAAALALEAPERRRRALRVMWVFLGLAFLFKGPPALLPLAGVAWAWRFRADPRRGPGLVVDPVGVLLFAALGLSWFAWLALHAPATFLDLAHRELVVSPFVGGLHRGGPFWMPAAVLAVGSLPWGVVLLPRCFRRRRPEFSGATARMLAGWCASGLVLFTLSRSRMPLYVLPLFTALCAPAGIVISSWSRGRGARRGVVIAATILFGAGLLAARAGAGKLPGLRTSEPLAAAVRALRVDSDQPVVLLRSAFAPGLAFALQEDLLTVATEPSATGAAADLTLSQLSQFVATRPQGVVAVGEPAAFQALPGDLVAANVTLDSHSGLAAGRLRRRPAGRLYSPSGPHPSADRSGPAL